MGPARARNKPYPLILLFSKSRGRWGRFEWSSSKTWERTVEYISTTFMDIIDLVCFLNHYRGGLVFFILFNFIPLYTTCLQEHLIFSPDLHSHVYSGLWRNHWVHCDQGRGAVAGRMTEVTLFWDWGAGLVHLTTAAGCAGVPEVHLLPEILC